MKRILTISFLILAMLCIFTICVGAVDVDGVSYSLNDDASPPTASVTGFVKGTSVVKIPSTITSGGKEYRVTAITGTTNRNSVKELYITSEYITVLSNFTGSTNLEKIYISSPIETFKSACFGSCSKVTDVYIDFSHTVTIESNAFFFSGSTNTQSKAVWNYGGEAINLYNVTRIDSQAFACSRIGGAFEGGTVNTIIWPKKMTYFGAFAFTNACLGGTVYINSTEVASNKQFSYANSFDTLILGPDCATIYNFNNGSDNYIKQTLDTVVILSKQLVNGASRTNLFDNWGNFDLYYYSDIQAVIDKQTTIGEATHHVIDSHTLGYDVACALNVEAFAGGVSLKSINNTHHAYDIKNGVANDSFCPVGSVVAVTCSCTQASRNMINYGYTDASPHDYVERLCYPDGFSQQGVLYQECSACSETSARIYSPMIYSLGYSYSLSETSRTVISSGYTVDSELVDLYNSTNGVTLEIGILFASADSVANEVPESLEGFNYYSDKGSNTFSTYNFKVRFPSKSDDTYAKFAKAEFVATAFIYDGENYYFYQGLDDCVTVLESGFSTATLNHVLGEADVEECEKHTFGLFEIISEATCTEPAKAKETCTVCGYERISVDDEAKGHTWGDIEEIFFGLSTTCTTCGEVASVQYQNATLDLVSSPATQTTFEGSAWGSYNIANMFNGVWDEENPNTISPKAVDCTLTITLDKPDYFNFIYVKNRGYASIVVSVLYSDCADYVIVDTLNSVYGTVADSVIPYASVDSTRKISAVKILIDNPSNGTDYLEEIAFARFGFYGEIPKEQCCITYNPGIGYFTNGFDSYEYVDEGSKFTDHPIPVCENTSMVFAGWYKDVNCTIPVTDDDIYTASVTLYAKWELDTSCADGERAHTVRVWTESVSPTCYSTGTKTGTCEICKNTVIEILPTTPHTETTVSGTPPTCVDMGIADEVLCGVCGEHIRGGELLDPTDVHTFNESNWVSGTLATKYTSGIATNTCNVCANSVKKEVPYTATEEELSANSIVVKYTGGKYVNEIFANLSPLGRVNASSFFRGTSGANVIDRDYTTFWNADTYVDGANYVDDYVIIELPSSYDIGVITLTVPNYYSYNLGADCYVSYNIEYWNATTGAWVLAGTVSDKDITGSGSVGQVSITLGAPINTQKVRATVAHATRYTPAVIYELELFGMAQSFGYTVENITNLASVSVSGRYNDYAGGAEALTDNNLGSSWFTDARTGGEMSALMEFNDPTYVACLQVAIATSKDRAFKIEVYENGEWTELSRHTALPTVGGDVISCTGTVSTINVIVERTVSKIKFTITKEPVYWESNVYEIDIYSVSSSTNDAPTTECKHEAFVSSQVVAPTCVSTGYTLVKCSSCSMTFKTNATDMLTHSFGEYSVLTAATSTSVGTKISSCANCDATCTITYEEGYEAPVVTPYRHDAPAAWAQTFDDGNYMDTYDWVIPQLQKYGYRATAMLAINMASSYVDTWNEHVESGVFDIGSHSYSHGNYYNSYINSDNLLSDVVTAQLWLRSAFAGQKVLTFAAPNGATSDDVANYLAGIFVANRNGGQGYAFYNVISDLKYGRTTWGNLNSYISKVDQTEGDYIFTNSNGSAIFVINADGGYTLDTSYANKNINLVYDESAGTYVNKGSSAGTYRYDSENYRYDFYEVGSYNLVNGGFVFVNDNSGEFKLVKATMGSYESAIDTLISKGGFTVECLHSLGSGPIYSTYNSTISKFEYLAKRGVWAPSYQDLVMYLKEAQSAKVETVSRTDKTLTINVTDELDDFMFDYALTVKVDIDDSWQSVVVTQNGVEIPIVSIDNYRASKNMSTVSCAIEDGYLYIDVVPDGGEVVITANAFLEETDDDNAQIGTDIWDLLG